jgi:hypothetical protein
MKTMVMFNVSGQGPAGKFLVMLTGDPKSTGVTPNDTEQDNRDACIANIGPRERFKRLMGGIIPFVFALAILAWQISADVDRLWRLPLFLLFVAATSGYFQWRDKT